MGKIISWLNTTIFIFRLKLLKANIKGLSALAAFCHRLILILFIWFVKIENSQNLKKLVYPVIFVFNHNNYFETLLVPCVLFALTGQLISFMVHWFFLYLPIIGWAVRQIKPIIVYNRRTRFKFLQKFIPKTKKCVSTEALLRIKAGYSVGIFPEASCNPSPFYLKRGKHGIAKLAYLSSVPIVPIGIDFPARLKKNKIPVLGRIILRIGRPIYFYSFFYGQKKGQELNRAYKNFIDLVRQSIAEFCGKKYKQGGNSA